MSTINVLVAVNVGEAIAKNNLSAYVFMVDTTGRSGDGNEGGNELVTTVQNGDTIVWTVTSIDPNEKVSILGFTGQAISSLVNPMQYPQFDGTVWGGRVNRTGTHVQYSMVLLLEGTVHMTFDPYITATDPA